MALLALVKSRTAAKNRSENLVLPILKRHSRAASLAGLAPVARQSGNWTGRAFIRRGRANVRQAIYMPALVARRFNPDLTTKYEQLIAAGKPPKKAIIAIMRKIIVLANAFLRETEMDPIPSLTKHGYSNLSLPPLGWLLGVRPSQAAQSGTWWDRAQYSRLP